MAERYGTTGQDEKIKMLSETRDNGTGSPACPTVLFLTKTATAAASR